MKRGLTALCLGLILILVSLSFVLSDTDSFGFPDDPTPPTTPGNDLPTGDVPLTPEQQAEEIAYKAQTPEEQLDWSANEQANGMVKENPEIEQLFSEDAPKEITPQQIEDILTTSQNAYNSLPFYQRLILETNFLSGMGGFLNTLNQDNNFLMRNGILQSTRNYEPNGNLVPPKITSVSNGKDNYDDTLTIPHELFNEPDFRWGYGEQEFELNVATLNETTEQLVTHKTLSYFYVRLINGYEYRFYSGADIESYKDGKITVKLPEGISKREDLINKIYCHDDNYCRVVLDFKTGDIEFVENLLTFDERSLVKGSFVLSEKVYICIDSNGENRIALLPHSDLRIIGKVAGQMN